MNLWSTIVGLLADVSRVFLLITFTLAFINQWVEAKNIDGIKALGAFFVQGIILTLMILAFYF